MTTMPGRSASRSRRAYETTRRSGILYWSFFASKRAFDLVLGRLGRGLEALGVGEHVLDLHLVVAAPELALDLGVAHRGRGAHEVDEALAQQLAAQRLRELVLGRALQGQAAADLVGADEAAVVLEVGRRRDRARHRLVGDADAEPLRLELDDAVGHERVEHLVLEAELLHHRRRHPALVEPVVDLALALERALELADRDRQAADRRDGLARRALVLGAGERGDVEDDERGDHQPEEHVQPAAVPAHQGEGHAVSVRAVEGHTRRGGRPCKVAILCPAAHAPQPRGAPAFEAGGVGLYCQVRLSDAGSGDFGPAWRLRRTSPARAAGTASSGSPSATAPSSSPA